MSAVTFSLLCALVLAALYNNALWRVFLDNVNFAGLGDYGFALFAFIALSCWLCVFLLLGSVKYLTRPFAVTVFIVAALVSYFASEYGVIINKSMIRNALQTDVREARELMNWNLLLHMVLYALVPILLMLQIRIRYRPFVAELRQRLVAIVITILVLLGSIGLFYKEFTFLFRQHTVMRSLINPVYPISSFIKVLRHRPRANAPVEKIGLDAKRVQGTDTGLPLLMVVVVGETARADHFSLNGYTRITNPLLQSKAVFNFRNTRSCGTSTAESLPCMFAPSGRADYSPAKAAQMENILDIAQRTGVRTVWLDNNSGCKGVCKRIPDRQTWNLKQADLCKDGECFDEILLQELSRYLRQNPKPTDTLIILHQKGSHGPAYYKRVPDRFRKYTPECNSVSLQECQRQEVINSYDNTILYTDFFLSKLIESLQKESKQYKTGLIYMSDHGESLGELGIYLHGLPYVLAPAAQTHIPHIEWYSPELLRLNGISRTCLSEAGKGAYSHDNLFHTLLGLMNIKTRLYQPDLDILRQCQPS